MKLSKSSLLFIAAAIGQVVYAAKPLPKGRIIVGDYDGKKQVGAVIRDSAGVGFEYGTTEEMDKLLKTSAEDSYNNFDVRPWMLSLPNGTGESKGVDIQKLIAVVEFSDIPSNLEIANFLMFLVKGTSVTQTSERIEECLGACRFYYGDEAKAIVNARTALQQQYEIQWDVK